LIGSVGADLRLVVVRPKGLLLKGKAGTITAMVIVNDLVTEITVAERFSLQNVPPF